MSYGDTPMCVLNMESQSQFERKLRVESAYTGGMTEGRTDGRTERQTDRQTDEQTDRRTDNDSYIPPELRSRGIFNCLCIAKRLLINVLLIAFCLRKKWLI